MIVVFIFTILFTYSIQAKAINSIKEPVSISNNIVSEKSTHLQKEPKNPPKHIPNKKTSSIKTKYNCEIFLFVGAICLISFCIKNYKKK